MCSLIRSRFPASVKGFFLPLSSVAMSRSCECVSRFGLGRGTISNLAVMFLLFTWLCCLVVADFVVDGRGGGEAGGLGGGEELYRRGDQTSLVPHGQQGIMVLLPQAPRDGGCRVGAVLHLCSAFLHLQRVFLAPCWLFAVRRTDGETKELRDDDHFSSSGFVSMCFHTNRFLFATARTDKTRHEEKTYDKMKKKIGRR